jgi:hypothetical protein
MINSLQINLLFFIDKKAGANKQLYIQFKTIYNATDKYSEDELIEALDGLTNLGYLESRDWSYRLTLSGLIFIEAYIISEDIGNETRQTLKHEIKEELQEEMKTRLGYQWLVIIVVFLVILAVVFLK